GRLDGETSDNHAVCETDVGLLGHAMPTASVIHARKVAKTWVGVAGVGAFEKLAAFFAWSDDAIKPCQLIGIVIAPRLPIPVNGVSTKITSSHCYILASSAVQQFIQADPLRGRLNSGVRRHCPRQ